MRPSTTSYRPAVLATAALVLSLTACGGATSPAAPAPATASTTSTPGIVSTHGNADVAFIQDMAPHHSGAIAMAELAASRAGSAQVKDLARRISGAQGPEIERMTAMASAWRVTLDTGAAPMGGMSAMGGDDVAALTPLSGTAFDKEFLLRMTAHHTSAVEMARTELSQGTNPQAKDLATAIVAAQQKEIAEMRGLLAAA